MTIPEILTGCTAPVRKGEQVEVERHGAVESVHLYLMPAEGEIKNRDELELYDLHFIHVAVHREKAEELREEFTDAISQVSVWASLVEGPSYITLGGLLGSQDAALAFIALGAHFGWWEIITPASFGATGAQADAMAGGGLVLMTPPKIPA